MKSYVVNYFIGNLFRGKSDHMTPHLQLNTLQWLPIHWECNPNLYQTILQGFANYSPQVNSSPSPIVANKALLEHGHIH